MISSLAVLVNTRLSLVLTIIKNYIRLSLDIKHFINWRTSVSGTWVTQPVENFNLFVV